MTPTPMLLPGSRLLLLFLLLLLGGSRAWAQETEMEGTLPDSIVVTASRLPEESRTTGRRVTVITAAEITAHPAASVDELLRTAGGVEVQSRGGFGVQSDLTMRGSTFNGVLVLIDGARLNDPMVGHFLADIPIPLSEVARIEILRGPATALYGPDAIGGVVQIFTYAGLEAGVTSERIDGSASAQVGRYGYASVDAAARRLAPNGSFSLAGTYQESDGMPITGESGLPIVSTDGHVRTDFTRQAYTAAYGRALAGGRLFVRAGVDDRTFGAFHFYTPFASDTAREETHTYWAQARFQGNRGATRWEIQGAAKEHGDEYVYNPMTPANRHTSRLYSISTQLARPVHPAILLSGGLSASLRSIDSNNLGTHDDPSAGAYVYGRWQPVESVTLNASGRVDYDPGYGFEPTPQVSLAYNHASVTLRAGISRAVRAPNYVERYYNTTLASPRGATWGIPTCVPNAPGPMRPGSTCFRPPDWRST